MNNENQKTILLVEDDPILETVGKTSLEKRGYSVITVNTGETAIETINKLSSIKLILMDIDLGDGIDGTEAAAIILRNRDIPIVFLSSHIEPEIVEKTEKITSYGYVVKNSGITVLDASIKMAFKLFEAKQKAKDIKDKLEATLDALPDILFEVGIDGYIYDCHSPNPELLFHSISKIIGKTIQEILPANIVNIILSALNEAHEKGYSTGKQFEITLPTGVLWYEISVSYKNSDSNEPHFIVLCHDITKRKQAQEQLLISTARYLDIIEDQSEFICRYLPNGILTFVNGAYSRYYGKKPSELINKNFLPQIPEPDLSMVLNKLGEITIDNPVVSYRHRVIHSSGEIHWQRWTQRGIYSNNGTLLEYQAVGFDITEHKNAEMILAESEKRYRTMIESSPEPICVLREWKLIYTNSAVVKMFGANSDQDLLGRHFKDLVHTDYRQIVLGKVENKNTNLDRNLPKCENKFIKLDGTIIDVEVQCTEIIYDGEPAIHIVMRDITSQKQTEQILKESEEKFRTLFEKASDGIFIFNSNMEINAVNESFAQMHGYTISEMIKMDLKTLDTPDSFQHASERTIRAMAGETVKFETRHFHKNGNIITLEVIASKIVLDHEDYIIAFHRDITERKLEEEKMKNLLEEKEIILKEVHHRIKNNLNVIHGLLILQSKTLNDVDSINALEDTANRVQSMMILYDKLYQSTNFQEISIYDYLPTLIDEILENFPTNTNLKVEKRINDFVLNSSKLQPLGIMINEILTNIMKYAFIGRSDGVIIIEAGMKAAPIGNGKIVSISIQDNGVGLPESIDFKNSTGFGIKLVGLLAKQLHGTLQIVRKNGTKIILEFEI